MTDCLFLTYSNLLLNWRVILVIAGFLSSFVLLIIILGTVGYRRKVKFRAAVAPLCSWEYSASQWLRYAETCGLNKAPKGAAQVRVTPLDIWIVDETKTVRLELTEKLKCVTDCRLANNVLKMRVLWVSLSGRGRIKTGAKDFQLFVPVGKEVVALKAVAYFKENKKRDRDKVALITRHNSSDQLVKDAWLDLLTEEVN